MLIKYANCPIKHTRILNIMKCINYIPSQTHNNIPTTIVFLSTMPILMTMT